MQDSLSDLRAAVSQQRFAEYTRTASGDAEAIGRYVWNGRLSEALYPALMHLEIALRNRLHSAISARYSIGPWEEVPCWLDLATPILRPEEVSEVNKAKWRLRRQSKPLDVGRMVAELNFGFWNSLLDLRYERSHALWPHLLKEVFPNVPRTDRKRKLISARINKIRLLRNRVFHYEPIWHWKDLDQQHEQLVEVLSWLSSDLLLITGAVDRFDDVLRTGWGLHASGVLG
jgi:hypothetical protein